MYQSFNSYDEAYSFLEPIIAENQRNYSKLLAIALAQEQLFKRHSDYKSIQSMSKAGNGLTFRCAIELSKHCGKFCVTFIDFRKLTDCLFVERHSSITEAVASVRLYLRNLGYDNHNAKFFPLFFTVKEQHNLTSFRKALMSGYMFLCGYNCGEPYKLKLSVRFKEMVRASKHVYINYKCLSKRQLKSFEELF